MAFRTSSFLVLLVFIFLSLERDVSSHVPFSFLGLSSSTTDIPFVLSPFFFHLSFLVFPYFKDSFVKSSYHWSIRGVLYHHRDKPFVLNSHTLSLYLYSSAEEENVFYRVCLRPHAKGTSANLEHIWPEATMPCKGLCQMIAKCHIPVSHCSYLYLRN